MQLLSHSILILTCAILVLSGHNSGIKRLVTFLVDHIPSETIAIGRTFVLPKNGLINGTTHLGIAHTLLPHVTFKIISYKAHKKLIDLQVDFPVIKHTGTYYNNVTILNTSKHVQDKTNLTLDLSSVSFNIRTNINSSKVWKLIATFTAKGNVNISGFLNDKKISEELSKNLTKNLPSILQKHKADISKFISPILEKQINRLYHA